MSFSVCLDATEDIDCMEGAYNPGTGNGNGLGSVGLNVVAFVMSV